MEKHTMIEQPKREDIFHKKPSKELKDIKHGDKKLEVKFIILEKTASIPLKNSDLLTQFLVADETASIRCNFFGEIGADLQPGDIIYMNEAYATTYKNMLILYQGKKGKVHRIGDFFFNFDETLLKSKVQ
ncbi:unnamed protein product [Moneuplotes crassus]|uniref:Uncharacterized protein n=1 Tax=Euplotes crassus TaxID=5936 RepID=A0AAD2D7S2_EUPCR|nr:unnamed protein product [Moneuplotes crassus]